MKKATDRYFGKLLQEWEEARPKIQRGPYDDITYVYPEDRVEPEAKEYVTPELPLNKRFEGAWVLGSQGSGKTQFFKRQAKLDLDMVAAGKASMVIIDAPGCHPAVYEDGRRKSPSTLVHTLTRLRRFYKGGDLEGRLIYIDPSERGYTVPINLFTLRPDVDDEDAVDAATDSYISIITGLMRQTLSPFQLTPLQNAIEAAMAFPNPTLATLRAILAVHPPATRKYTPPPPVYAEILHKLDPETQEYFLHTYDTQVPRSSRSEVLNRIANMTRSRKFRRIFGADKSKINMAQFINEPNVVVINAARATLGSLTEVYGRYFLSLIRDAGLARPSGSIPCFVYVDECHQYIADDPITADIIFSLRQKNIALMLGNQNTKQITNPLTLNALLSTSIKLVNVREADGARLLAESMNYVDDDSRPIFRPLMARPELNFAYHDGSGEPGPFKFPAGVLEAEAAMTEDEWQEIWAGKGGIRDRFYERVQRSLAEHEEETAKPEFTNPMPTEEVAPIEEARPRVQRQYPPQRKPKVGKTNWTPPGKI